MILLTDEEKAELWKQAQRDGSNPYCEFTPDELMTELVAKAQLKKVAGQMEDTYDKAPIGKKLAVMERFMLDLLKEVE